MPTWFVVGSSAIGTGLITLQYHRCCLLLARPSMTPPASPQFLRCPPRPAPPDNPITNTTWVKKKMEKYIWNVYYDLGKQFWQWGENFPTVNFELNYHQNILHLNTSFFYYYYIWQSNRSDVWRFDSDFTFVYHQCSEGGRIDKPSMRETT